MYMEQNVKKKKNVVITSQELYIQFTSDIFLLAFCWYPNYTLVLSAPHGKWQYQHILINSRYFSLFRTLISWYPFREPQVIKSISNSPELGHSKPVLNKRLNDVSDCSLLYVVLVYSWGLGNYFMTHINDVLIFSF